MRRIIFFAPSFLFIFIFSISLSIAAATGGDKAVNSSEENQISRINVETGPASIPAKGNDSASDNTADPIEMKVLVLNFDPAISKANPERLHTLIGNDPRDLAERCVDDLKDVSFGVANYKIAEWIDVETLVPFELTQFKPEDGIDPGAMENVDYIPSYNNAEQYLETMKAAQNDEKEGRGSCWASPRWHGNRGPGPAVSASRADFNGADYKAICEKFAVAEKVNNGKIDEVWIFAPHMSGLSTSRMAGPEAFFINGNKISDIGCRRNFAIMGFNYAYPVVNMLGDFGMRMECTMDRVFGMVRTRNANHGALDYNSLNLWERFIIVDKVMSGKSALGTINFAPNGRNVFDWQSPVVVDTYYPDWETYPDFKGRKVSNDCRVWAGDLSTNKGKWQEVQRQHHKWWFRHIPHVKGTIKDVDGKEYLNNWWSYMLRNSSANK